MTQANTAQAPQQAAFNATTLMRRCGEHILKGLGWEEIAGKPLRIHTYAEGPEGLVARLSLDETHAVVKAFNLDLPEASYRLNREVQISRALKGRGLAPDILAFSERHGFMLSTYVEGQTLSEFLTADNLPLVAGRLGTWFRVFQERIPTRTAQGQTWGSYLAAYDGLFTEAEMAEFRPFFETLPITSEGIAKNDAFLDNFLRSDEGRLLGLDYAESAVKPVGWDLLLTARILTQQFPDMVNESVAALMRGWGRDVGGIALKEFGRLAVIFASATADRRPQARAGVVERFAQSYTEKSLKNKNLPEISRTYRVPSLEVNMVAPEAASLASLREALHDMAQEAVNLPPAPEGQAPPYAQWRRPEAEPSAPSPLLAAACATCQGRCCTTGLEAHAHLTPQKLSWLAAAAPGITAKGIAEFYLSKLPKTHVAGSCLFHGQSGCTLPREARSERCNTSLCPAARVLDAAAPELQSGQSPVLLAAVEDNALQRASVVSSKGRKPLKLENFDLG